MSETYSERKPYIVGRMLAIVDDTIATRLRRDITSSAKRPTPPDQTLARV